MENSYENSANIRDKSTRNFYAHLKNFWTKIDPKFRQYLKDFQIL